MIADQDLLRPDWAPPDMPSRVRALITLRSGGHSLGPWSGPNGGGGMNLGLGTHDALDAVERNRAALREILPGVPRWLRQVHGDRVVHADEIGGIPPEADASYTTRSGVVCAVLVADCLPVLLADTQGRGVAAAHAGWRGLAAGILQNTVHALRAAIGDPAASLRAFLGPAIGPGCFEVGREVLDAMRVRLPDAQSAFVATGPGKFHANLFDLARQALTQVKVVDIQGGNLCTVCDPARFYSFRRDRVTGRHAALIWMESGTSFAVSNLED